MDKNITFGTQSDAQNHFVSLPLLGGEYFANHLRLTNQRTRRALFTCVVYTNKGYIAQ